MKRERSNRISRILSNQDSRAAYIQAKLSVLVPSQIRSLRLRSENPSMPRQTDLASATGLHQSRISMFETPGAANITLETLSKVAAGLKVGVVIKFVPFSEMLRWENNYEQDRFDVSPRLEEDEAFLNPSTETVSGDDGNQFGADLRKQPQSIDQSEPEDKKLASGAAAGGGLR